MRSEQWLEFGVRPPPLLPSSRSSSKLASVSCTRRTDAKERNKAWKAAPPSREQQSRCRSKQIWDFRNCSHVGSLLKFYQSSMKFLRLSLQYSISSEIKIIFRKKFSPCVTQRSQRSFNRHITERKNRRSLPHLVTVTPISRSACRGCRTGKEGHSAEKSGFLEVWYFADRAQCLAVILAAICAMLREIGTTSSGMLRSPRCFDGTGMTRRLLRSMRAVFLSSGVTQSIRASVTSGIYVPDVLRLGREIAAGQGVSCQPTLVQETLVFVLAHRLAGA